MRIGGTALHACLLASLLASPALAAADGEPAVLEEVRVQDEPGPLMWRVSRDDHVLWIIGTLTPVPKDLRWNTTQLAAVVKESAEVLAPVRGSVRVEGGTFAMLRDLLPPDQYARWQELMRAARGKEPKEDLEQWRPMILADALYYDTLEARGLVDRDPVARRLESIAKEAKVPVRRREFNVQLGKPRDLIREFRELPRDRELECLVATMDHIEHELPLAEGRARAWATGDGALLELDPASLAREPCTVASVRESSLKERLQQLEEEARQDFLDAAGYALLGRQTSVTTMPVRFLGGPKGLLEALRATGYTVESPRQAGTAVD